MATPTGVGGAGGSGTGFGGAGGMLPPPPPPPPFDAGNNNEGGGNSNVDMNCGAKNKPAEKLLPEILIVLDRSRSMNDDIMNMMCPPPDGGFGAMGSCGPDSKWAKVIPALKQVVTDTDADVRWGLKYFPDNSQNACNVSNTAAVPVGPMTAAAITTSLTGATDTNGGVLGFNSTPTRNAENGAVNYLKTLTSPNPKFILLATDGLPNCPASSSGGTGTEDSAGAIAAVGAAHTAGFPTFVVGIATGGGTSDTTLSSMADMGGLPRMGTPTYYPVGSAADLATAIRMLVSQAGSCTFQLGQPPTMDGTTSLSAIDVFGDGTKITRDPTHADGFDYTDTSMTSIQIHGPLCKQIMDGVIKDVNVTFRCLVP